MVKTLLAEVDAAVDLDAPVRVRDEQAGERNERARLGLDDEGYDDWHDDWRGDRVSGSDRTSGADRVAGGGPRGSERGASRGGAHRCP